jgi:hypothetical protein
MCPNAERVAQLVLETITHDLLLRRDAVFFLCPCGEQFVHVILRSDPRARDSRDRGTPAP